MTRISQPPTRFSKYVVHNVNVTKEELRELVARAIVTWILGKDLNQRGDRVINFNKRVELPNPVIHLVPHELADREDNSTITESSQASSYLLGEHNFVSHSSHYTGVQQAESVIATKYLYLKLQIVSGMLREAQAVNTTLSGT